MSRGSDAPGDGPLRTPKGMHDIVWPESSRWERLVARFAALVEGAGYGLAITPVLEHVGIFNRGIGEGSDVVHKEMYTFADRDGQIMALRPEGTASIVRSYVQHHPVPPWKAWYAAPSFRHENPQKGRYRQHFQLGVEALGPSDADLDVEVVSMAFDFIASLGLHQVTLKLNSMGDENCRPEYLELLRAFLAERRSDAVPVAPGALRGEPAARARLQDPRVRERHRECAPVDRQPVRTLHRPLRPGAGRSRRARRALHHRPPSGARVRLLHPHHVRVRLGRHRRRAERAGRRWPLQRPGRDAGGSPDAGHRLRPRRRAAS